MSTVTLPAVMDFTEARMPEPSPKSILPKLNFADFKSPSISAVSRLTNAPALFAEARTALSLISMVPYRFLSVAVNSLYKLPEASGSSPSSAPAPIPPFTP